MKKRDFLKTLTGGLVGAVAPFTPIEQLIEQKNKKTPEELASDEQFWSQVRAGYRLKPDYINLENGYYCIQPTEVLEKHLDHARAINYQGSWYMRKSRFRNKEMVANRLADFVGAEHGEVVVTRNTTESLDLVIGGFPWKEGDEAIYAEQDYFSMRQMFELQEETKGIKCKVVSVPNHPADDEELVKLYEDAITEKTRLIMVCHMVNVTGHILPIRKICDMAHARGVQVMVDGAHAIAHVDFNMKDLDCDYYGSSLHKWLSVPLGAGLLYVRRDRIADLTPLMASYCCEDDEIRRLNHIGTHPCHTDLSIIDAIEYHERLGMANKQARLRHIQRRWSDQVRDIDNVVVNTPRDPHRSCGIANVGISHMKPADLATALLEQYRIWTVAIDGHGVHGCRISPNIYTLEWEVDALANALRELAKA
ncbi:MAG: aminotransferase class V-fold PLP-dependent enzyme [Saprospiraceae bacterium]|nr:aminotransferase class V-fold PLP-dependent enzyme [Saprospiraceae bacterium]